MKGPLGFGKMVNILMNLFVGFLVSIVVVVTIGAPLLPNIVLQSWFCSFIIGYTFGDLVPIASLGPSICRKAGIRARGGVYVISSLCLGIYFGTVILLGMSIINNLSTAGWGAVFGFFGSMWIIVVVAAVVSVLLVFWLAQIIARGVSGFDPAKAAAEAAAAEA